ncbi:MAG TPA: phosphatidate cytidylyltransferase [Burkholderiales bacterium]
MMTTRILTAAALIAVVVAALFFLPRTGWLVLAAIMLAQGAWEWGGLARLGAAARAIYTMALVIALLWLAYDPDPVSTRWAYYVAAVFWVIVAPWWLWRRPAFGGPGAPLAAGVVVLVPAFLALVLLRDDGGPLALLALMMSIWISDTAALFAGRRFGRRKLAPEVSPGKTWEGVYGALVAVAVYGALTGWGFMRSGLIAPRASLFWSWILMLLAIAAAGVVGDLFESQMKRAAGVKDSGNLLPGHGGWLDRIDAQTAALPVAALIFSAFQAA